MDPSKLADRLRAIVGNQIRLKPDPTSEMVRLKPDTTYGPPDDVGSGFSRIASASDVTRVLEGDWCQRDGVSCLVVERRYTPDTQYGCDRVGTIAVRLSESAGEAPL